MNRNMTYTFLFVSTMLCGCSTICPEGLKFGPYATICAPYEAYKLVKSIHNDIQPGGMLNPNGEKDDEIDLAFGTYSTPTLHSSEAQGDKNVVPQ